MVTSVSELIKCYGDGTLTPRDAIEECLNAIEALDPAVGAWQAVYEEEARAAADLASIAIVEGTPKGPFHGVPFALKDIVDVEGKIT
ncbi:MAG: amidase family protein, partial [Actinomycetota bacterium]|nr:amidase family protein [Actinomycetota bacterium]